MTVREALEAREGLRVLGGYRLDTLVAVRVARLARALDAALKPFHEVHDGVIAEVTDGADTVNREHPGWPEYVEARDRLMADELGAEIAPVTVKASGLRDGVEPNVLLAIGDLLEIVED